MHSATPSARMRASRRAFRRGPLLLSVLALAIACGRGPRPNSAQDLRPIGAGFYTVRPPTEERGPADASGQAARPKVVDGFAQPPQTNDWWSSLIWSYQTGARQNPYSERMFPHPLSMQAEAHGLWLGYPTEPKVEDRGYYYEHLPEVLVGVEGMNAPDTRVVSYGDWTVTARWADGEHALDLTAGHGLPFVYATHVKGRARVAAHGSGSSIWKSGGATAALTVNGHHYALFAPPGASWVNTDGVLSADLAGQDYFSVAVLPERSDAALALFQEHAYAFVTDSKVSYRYDQAAAQVITHFELSVEPKLAPGVGSKAAPSTAPPLMALYRHQWRHSTASLTTLTYVSPRGEMKLLEGVSFDTALPISGLLPGLPDRGSYDKGRLTGLLKLVANDELFKPGLEGTRDSYWEGKSFGKIAGLVRIADQLDEPGMRDELLNGLKRELEDWFDGQPPRYYYRNETWRTLIGIPTMYQSGAQLNDHHFHYAYYVFAAATVAQYDLAWAQKWSPFVETLIKDADNWQRADTSFPYLRYFDAYAGHSWASGTTFFATGNNEESSSEDMNFASAVALWGEVMHHTEVRDLGLFLYANVTEAIAQYWYDVERAVYPKGFAHPAIGIVWGSGAAYDTWFSPLPESAHGIQLTPMLTGCLWLGKYPAALDRVWDHLIAQRGAPPVIWRDLFWMQMALSHPERASTWFDDEHAFAPDDGNSLAYTYYFIENLKVMGRFDPSVSADTPLHAVFLNHGKRTCVAYNAGDQPLRATFSNGQVLTVPPRSLASAVR